MSFAKLSQMIALLPVYMVIGSPVQPSNDGIPFVNNDSEYTMAAIPTSLSFRSIRLFDTLAFWLEIASLGGKQYLVTTGTVDPFLGFDEMTLSIIALWNTTLALMDVNFQYAFGLLVLQLPWMLMLPLPHPGPVLPNDHPRKR